MLLRNVLHSTALLIKRRRPYLPSLRKLGSRLLNAIVILSFILPNMTIAVQAATPDEVVYIPRVEYVSKETAEIAETVESGLSYQAPAFTHPEPRKGNNPQGEEFTILPVENDLLFNKTLQSPIFNPSSLPPASPLFAPPANDDFDYSVAISSLPYSTQVDITEATTAVDDPVISCLGDTGTHSLWYAITPSASGLMSFDTSGDSNYDTVLAVWTGTRGSLTEIACSDDAYGVFASLTQYVTSSITYYIEVVGKESLEGVQHTLEIDLVADEVSGLQGSYFNNSNLEGDPEATQQDSTINFSWGQGSPMAEINPDNFSVQWIGSIEPEYDETYTFHSLSDDGVRLWVDGEQLIDNWTEHDPTWDSGSKALLAGVKYPIRLEYFEADDDASIRLEWSSASTPQEIIPASQLTTLDLGGSIVEAGPVQVNLTDQSTTITVTLMSGDGELNPISDQQIYLQVSGTNNFVNDLPLLTEGEWIDVGTTDYDGEVTAELSSPDMEYKIVRARTDNTPIFDTEEVDFLTRSLQQYHVLLYGRTHVPGPVGTITGTPEPIYTGEPTTFEIIAVDSTDNIVEEYHGTAIISIFGGTADVPPSVALEDGRATVLITHNESGIIFLQVDHELPPGQTEPVISGLELVIIEDNLTVVDGETFYVDDDRYVMDENLAAGTTTLPYNGIERILPGHNILIATMEGSGLGDHEIHEVASVGIDTLEITAPLAGDYNGTSDSVIIQRVPFYPNIEVQSGGEITAHDWNGNTGGIVAFEVDTAGQLTVASGGTIDVSGLGFEDNEGPGGGASVGLGQGAGGGGHGGRGGNSTGSGGGFYSPFETPFAFGSPGGDKGVPGGKGGGIIYIDAFTAVVNGIVKANGTNGQESWGGAGGGAGGSIQIHSASLSGTGTIQTNGGNGAHSNNYPDGGGGGGGRIYLSDYFAATQDYGGSGQQYGGAGTIVTHYPVPLNDQLKVDNNGHNGSYAGVIEEDVSSLTDHDIKLTGYGHLRAAGSASSFTVDNNSLSGDGTATLTPEGTLYGPVAFSIDDITISVLGELESVQDITIGADGQLVLRAQTSLHSGIHTYGDITVESGGYLRLIPYDNYNTNYEDDLPCVLSVDNLTVESGATVRGYSDGYRAAYGPGAGTSAPNNGQGAGGAGYGGEGGDSTYSGGSTYGDLYQPEDLGSGGGNRNVSGGKGGGAIRLQITGTLDLDGTISVDGGNGGESYGGAGGGSGGSIWITAGTFEGSGTLAAEGGNGGASGIHPDGGGGGGGRIAVYATLDVFIGDVIIDGGSGGNYIGENGVEGTKYFNNIDPLLSTVSIAPEEVTADGVNEATITVTLVNAFGSPLYGELVKVALSSGGSADINGQSVSIGQYVEIGTTDASGQATATIAAATLGTRAVIARGGNRDILIQDQGDVTFIPGPVDEGNSTVETSVSEAPADGVTEVTITVTALDAQGHPIPDLPVTISATGSAVVTQPTSPTNSQGEATGSVRNDVIETVTVSVAVDGISLGAEATVQFSGADPAANLTAPGEAMAGAEIIENVQVENLGNTTAGNVEIVLDLPVEMSFVSHTAGIEPTAAGNSYTWAWGDVLAAELVEFDVTVLIDGATPEETDLVSMLTVSTTSDGDDPGNNTSQATTSIGEFHIFTSSMEPASRTLRLGGTTEYTIQIQNQGYLTDSYDLSVTGLDAGWISFSENPATIGAGGIKNITLFVEPTGCLAEDILPFDVTIVSDGDGQTEIHSADLILDQDPLITIDGPQNGATSGSRSVLFSWRSDPETTGELTVYPQGDPGSAQTFNTTSDTNHSVLVPDLTRYETYVWSVEATSACGSAISADRTLTIGSGIVFTNHNQNVTINRDYDQRVNIAVYNEDSVEHTLTATVISPYDDLFVNFVDGGSVDEGATITLQPGETAQLILAVNSQDATQSNYTLTAHLTADEGTGTPIEDQASINLTVLFDNDYTITEGALDPITLGREYTITNNGMTITDLLITATKPGSKEPASVYITPNISHAKLETGESLTVTLYPIFTEEDMAQASINTAGHVAATRNAAANVDYDFHAKTNTEQYDQYITSAAACETGREILEVTMSGCTYEFVNNDWYCTNRPEISFDMQTPHFLKVESIESANLQMSYSPHSNVQPHSGQIYFNDYNAGSFTDQVPTGAYTYKIEPNYLNTSAAGMARQNIQLSTQHPNPGHYVSNTNNTLLVEINTVSFHLCAASETEALQIAEEQYPCNAGAADDYLTDIMPEQIEYSNVLMGLQAGGGEICPAALKENNDNQEFVGDPINSQTGAFSFGSVDLSVPIQSCNLAFQPAYSTAAINETLDGLGYGWTHNHALKLIFPEDPGGIDGFVLYQGISGNHGRFKIETDGSYTPGPGIPSTLTKNDGPPISYTIESANQKTLTFNEDGQILSRVDALGFGIDYTYDVNGRLERVEANDGSRYLDFTYDGSDRIVTVTDHASRSVSYTYDANGDLTTTTDVMGEDWDYTYDSSHRMTTFTDPRGVDTVQTEYDMQGRAFRQHDGEGNLLVEIIYYADGTSEVIDGKGNDQTHAYDDRNTMVDATDALGGSVDKTYNANFRPETITDQEGNTTTLVWSADGANLTQVEDADNNITALGYDSLNNLTSVVDAGNNLTTYTYDGTLMTSVTDVFLETTSYTYTVEGWVETVTDPLGNTTTYGYDTLGQMTSMEDALLNTTAFTYDTLGRLIDTTDASGKVTHNEYDLAGRLIKVTQNYDLGRPQNDQNEYNIVTEYAYDEVGNRASVTDTYGNNTTYTYDNNNQLIAVTDPELNTTTHVYDVNGNRISTTDALNRTTTFVYDALNRLVETIDALGNSTETAYNADGTVDYTEDALNRRTYYTYDNLQRVTDVTDPLSGVSSTVYDELGNVTTTTDALGREKTYEYDTMGRLVKSIDPELGETEHFYNEVGNRVQTIDPNDNATTYTYDDLGRVETVTDAQGNVTTYTYNDVGQRETVTDPATEVTTFRYDTLGRQISVTDPLLNTSSTTYDALGRVVASTNALGRTTTNIYNDLGQLESRTDPDGGVTSFTYDDVGNQLTVTDANNHTTIMVYDELNRPVEVIDPTGYSTYSTYNAVGSLTAIENHLGEETTFGYDSLNRQISMTDPLDETTQYTYDAVGNRTSVTDAKGVVTKFEYNDLNRLNTVIENYRVGFTPDHETNVRTEYTYDANGNRLTIKDGRNNTTTFTYTSLNQLETETDPLSNAWSHTYEERGLLETSTDANGVSTTFLYDELGRRTGIDYPGTAEDVSLTYNALGQPLTMNDGVGTTTWAYDILNRVDTVNDPFGDTVGYDYDAVGNRKDLTYSDGKHVSYAYDDANQLTTVTDWDSRVTQYDYDPAGRILSRTLPNGVLSNFGYDATGHLLSLAHSLSGDTLSSFVYTYDPVGNRTQVIETYGQEEAGPVVTITVMDDTGAPMDGIQVYAFDETISTGYNGITDTAGEVEITLPGGDYRFRIDVDGTQYWSGETDHCQIAGCTSVLVTIPSPVIVTVADTDGIQKEGISVYAFSGGTYTNYTATTDTGGLATFRLPPGDYRFQADYEGTQFWSGEEDHCAVSGCTLASIEISLPVVVSVVDTVGTPQEGVNVYVYDDATYTEYTDVTDTSGEVSFTLPFGDYRFRADYNGIEFWSDTVDHCVVPGCLDTEVIVSPPVTVTVVDTDGGPAAGLNVYAFDGTTYQNLTDVTNASGEVEFTLPMGDYRFRVDKGGRQFWSDIVNHCTLPGCDAVQVEVTKPVTVSVVDTDGAPKDGLTVYVFDGTTYQSISGTTDAAGEVEFTLLQGDYRFRSDLNGTQFWSGAVNHCTLPGCESASVTVTIPMTVTVLDWSDVPQVGVNVYAFDGTTYTNFNDTTDGAGEIEFTLPEGGYRFRADFGGEQYWSDAVNHCDIPGCLSVEVRVGEELLPTATATPTATEAPTPTDTPEATATDTPQPTATDTPLPTDTPEPTATDAPGPTATDTPEPTAIDTPTPTATEVTLVGGGHSLMALIFPYNKLESPLYDPGLVTITVEDTDGTPKEGIPVYVFDGENYTGINGITDINGEVGLDLPAGNYRFRADLGGTQFWSDSVNHCTVPGCASASVTVTKLVVVTVSDTDAAPRAGLNVYVFDETTYTSKSGVTDASGEVSFVLPEGDYRFRADLNGTQFWSGAANHCTIPGCETASVEVTKPVTVSVVDSDTTPQEGLNVYVFDGTTYTTYNGVTDANGEVVFTLPHGDYRFRADLSGTQFWSGETNHCTLPGCETANVTVAKPVVVTVSDTDLTPKEGLSVYAFDGENYIGFTGTTDASGEVSFILPDGDYRFRADLNGTQFWSGASNHCSVPSCEAADVTVTKPVTVSVISQVGTAYSDLNVYVFDGEDYTGFNSVSDANGEVIFTLPEGDYRFRADLNEVQFWSGETDHCVLPGCETALVEVPGAFGITEATIDYTYDPLYRLTAADYDDDDGTFFHYAYDAVGNRLTQDTLSGTNAYAYDIANRLTSVDGVSYTWDNNGNLLADGTSVYTYNYANMLASVNQGGIAYTYAYNGLGDRLQQTIDGVPTNYTLNIISGLTHVLADGMHTYLYGQGRIMQEGAAVEYFLGDALNSVRQLTDSTAEVTLTQSYEPYGSVLSSMGNGESIFNFTGEIKDESGLTYLRARYLNSESGRFISKDIWQGDISSPLSQNSWVYVEGNPINYIDPVGLWRWALTSSLYHIMIENYYEDPLLGLGLLNPNKQLEYRIPGTRRRPDMFNSLTGAVYEVEPWYLANSSSHGTPQAIKYVNELRYAASNGLLEGYYFGVHYKWNSTPFHLGNVGDWPGKYKAFLPNFPMVNLVADYVSPGLIVYWLEPSAEGLMAIGASLPLLVPNRRLVKPGGWSPGEPAYQPAMVVDVNMFCGYALIFAGGAVIVVTLAEDIVTLGIGVFDDILTIPGGLLMIDYGQRLAVPIIVR